VRYPTAYSTFELGLQVMDLAHLEGLKHPQYMYRDKRTRIKAAAAFQNVVLQLGRLTELKVKCVEFSYWLFSFPETDLASKLR